MQTRQRPKEQNDMNANAMCFNKDGCFRILQVSDPQDLVHPRKAMINMLDAAYDSLHPDLVLFTGDNTLGNHLLDFGPFRIKTVKKPAVTLRQMRKALAGILTPVEKRGIPFAMIYGNHDDMNDVSKKEQFSLYRAYECCLAMNDSDPAVDCDTFHIPICSSDGKPLWNIYMLDSAWNDETGQYWRIKEETVVWYRRTSEQLKKENDGNPVPSLLFLHEPLPQIRDLFISCDKKYPGAVYDRDEWLCIDPSKASGVIGEPVSPCEDPFGLYEAIKEQNDVLAVISGHDHLNCFDGRTNDGVRMIQTAAASFRCYGGRVRGVRLFTLRKDDPCKFQSQFFTYDMLCGTNFRSQARYFWDADDKAKEKYTFLGGTALLAAGAAGAYFGLRLQNGK